MSDTGTVDGADGARAVPEGATAARDFTPNELGLATRNHGFPLELLREDVTPIGLHYLLIHYDIPAIDPVAWRLEIDGEVDTPMSLGLDDLHDRPTVTQDVTLECAGTGRARLSPRALSQPWVHEAVGTGRWTGTPLAPLLAEAGLRDDVVELVFTGLDRGIEGGVEQSYRRSLTVEQAMHSEALLVHGLNGQPLPPQHGFPVRLLVPGWYGMTQVKWLGRITAVTEPFEGYQQAEAYRYRTEPGEEGTPVTRMAVRSLLLPPGIPDFFSRERTVDAGPMAVEGRAWSGHGEITDVEFRAAPPGTDPDAGWTAAEVEPGAGPHAWQRWRTTWKPEQSGEHELSCRATDSAGSTQPLEADWNLGGYAVNAVHRVSVTVRDQRRSATTS